MTTDSDEGGFQPFANSTNTHHIMTSQSQVGKLSLTHLFGMGRTADKAQPRIGKTIMLLQIVGDKQVLVRDDAFDS